MVQKLNKIQTKNLLNNNIIFYETEGEINENILSQKINKIRYGEYDNNKEIKQRIKRCIKETKKERFKKADEALNNDKIVNLDINGNLEKVKSKFQNKSKIKIQNKKNNI